MKEIIIIVGHGSPEKDGDNTEFVSHRLHEQLHGGCEKKCVRAAYLQFMEPGLMGVIQESVSDGAQRIIIHPYFLSSGFHVTKNIPEIVRGAREMFPGVEFIYTDPLGAHDKLVEIVKERITAVADNLQQYHE